VAQRIALLLSFLGLPAILAVVLSSGAETAVDNPQPTHVGMPLQMRSNLSDLRVWKSCVNRFPVVVANPSKIKNVRMEGYKVSCDCLSLEPSSFSLLPGEERTLTLVVDYSSGRSEKSTHDYSIMPTLEDYEGTLVWKLGTTSGDLLSLSNHTLTSEYDNVREWGEVHKVQVISNVALKSLDIDGACEWLDARVSRKSTNEFLLSIQQTEATDEDRSWLSLRAVHEDNSATICRGPIFINQSRKAYFASPHELNYGFRDVGDEITKRITVRSDLDDRFRFADSSVNGIDSDSIDVDCVSRLAGELVLDITVTPREVGKCDGIVSVNLLKSDGKKTTVRVPIFYIGI